MLNINEIISAFKGYIGWDKEGFAIPNVETGTSGLTYQMAHPLMTIPNIRGIMPTPDETITDDYLINYPNGEQPRYPLYGAQNTYTKGDKVAYRDAYYIALQNVPQGTSPGNDEYWKVYSPMGDYLNKLEDQGIVQVMQRFVATKKVQRETKTLLERRPFFDGAGRLKATIKNTSKIVGLAITPARYLGVVTRIPSIGLQMTGATGNVRVYLFHSSQPEPIQTYNLNFTKENGGFQWFELGDVMPYIYSTNNAGGTWYLCYNQDELPFGMEAINMSKDWSKEPCSTCGVTDIRAWKEITKYIQTNPFMVKAPSTFAEEPLLWDVSEMMYTMTQNYGINCLLNVGCELTPFIIENKEVFADVIQKQVAYNALRTMALNPSVRVNRNQSNVARQDILYELDGNTQGRKGGLGFEIERAFNALEIDTKSMDRVCLCDNNHGVRYTTV